MKTSIKSRKAQAEIIGITIVMVLVMLGIIFVIRFVVMPDDDNIKPVFDRSQMAANFMDSLLKTTTSCNRLTVTELIQNCAEHYGNVHGLRSCPPDNSLGICAGTGCRSCEFLNQSIEYMLANSLDIMPQINYELYICRWDSANAQCYTTPEDMISSFSNANCRDRNAYPEGFMTKQQPIPTGRGNRVVQMYIC